MPFLYANAKNETLLLIYGENALNSGNLPMQVNRKYQALLANKKQQRCLSVHINDVPIARKKIGISY